MELGWQVGTVLSPPGLGDPCDRGVWDPLLCSNHHLMEGCCTQGWDLLCRFFHSNFSQKGLEEPGSLQPGELCWCFDSLFIVDAQACQRDSGNVSSLLSGYENYPDRIFGSLGLVFFFWFILVFW